MMSVAHPQAKVHEVRQSEKKTTKFSLCAWELGSKFRNINCSLITHEQSTIIIHISLFLKHMYLHKMQIQELKQCNDEDVARPQAEVHEVRQSVLLL